MSRAARALRIVAASTLLAALAVPAVAAAEPVAATLTITAPAAPIVCRVETEVSVLVLDANGATIAGKAVSWGLAPVVSSQDAVTAPESVTGSQGVATTKLYIDCIRGSRTLLVKADDAIASQVLSISDEGIPAATPTPPPTTDVAARLILTLPATPIVCRTQTEISVRVLDAGGATLAGKVVTWSIMPFASTLDSWTDDGSVTGSQGVATTQVWIDCVPGRRAINASVDGVTASADLVISDQGMPGATVEPSVPAETAPATSTVSATGGQGGVPGGMLVVGALALVGSCLILGTKAWSAARR